MEAISLVNYTLLLAFVSFQLFSHHPLFQKQLELRNYGLFYHVISIN